MRGAFKTNEWISISDLMAGLMMIFLLITVSFLFATQNSEQMLREKNKQLEAANQKMSAIARNFVDLESELNALLKREFERDLAAWDAVIDDDNTIRFREPEVLFDSGKAQVKRRFRDILDDFFPRYVKILTQEKYRASIDEVRIEGHTSSDWTGELGLEKRYLNNAELSQNRALEVLKYCFNMKRVDAEKEWLIRVLRANGLSFAKPMESEKSSRRVEFRVVSKAGQNLREILDVSKNAGE